jgi:hypothetical protein
MRGSVQLYDRGAAIIMGYSALAVTFKLVREGVAVLMG